MRSLFFKLSALAILFVFSNHANAQISPNTQSTSFSAPATYPIYLIISDSSIITSVTLQGKPVFNNAAINYIVNQYTVTGFEKAFPTSRYKDMRDVYEMNVSSLNLPQSLVATYPQYFAGYRENIQNINLLSYTPNDFLDSSYYRSTGYLDYIKARDAWAITKGDSTVVIGVHDHQLDTSNLDIAPQLVRVATNTNYNTDHGTRVSGLIAGRTDNHYGYPSIGFNCKLDFVGCFCYDEILKTSQRNRRIINHSWGSGGGLNDTVLFTHSYDTFLQRICQEVYENGTFSCAGAGNGYTGGGAPARAYTYPASNDYVFSVSGIGWKNKYGGPDTVNVIGVHEGANIGDSTASFQHNSRVDLLAPAYEISGLSRYGFYGPQPQDNGTSYATPLVSGTAGLILSMDKCYSPYQIEYILKKSADTNIFHITENEKYRGRLGAGALDASKAVKMVYKNDPNPDPINAPYIDCNDPTTTTFYIEGIDYNTRCVPGYSINGVKPILTPITHNGTPPYTYRWEAMVGNTSSLNAYDVAAPEVTSAWGTPVAYYRVTIYDASPIQKVASKIFKLPLTIASNIYDLGGKDAYMDMFDEPNAMDLWDPRDDNYYKSPDLWNRQSNDGDTIHQNPEYFQNGLPNYANVRIRNVGCKDYNSNGVPQYLHLYWTAASTGEKWEDDWDGSSTVPSSGSPLPAQIPSGGEITTGSGILIPSLQPGQSTILVQPWYPRKPSDFENQPDKINICLLARVANNLPPYYDMTIPEQFNTGIKTNVRNNNNIFTRNLWVEDNLTLWGEMKKIRVYIANAEDNTRSFDLQFINDKAINLHFAGNFSSIGKVTLYLGDLYDVWMDAGGDGHYLSRNPDTKTVVMDGSETLDMLNIPLHPGHKYPVDVVFSLYDGIIPNYQYEFHLRQFELNEDHQRLGSVYGSMSFQIHTSNADAYGKKVNLKDEAVSIVNPSRFSLHPNPATDHLDVAYLGDEEVNVDIAVYDMLGRKMFSNVNQSFKNSYKELDISGYVPGIYVLNITHKDGSTEQFKFVKK